MRLTIKVFLSCLAMTLLLGLNNVTHSQENEPAPEARQQQPDRNSRRSGRRERFEQGDSLVAGQMAPVFKLNSLDGKQKTSLTELRSEKPVILFMGSYT